MAKCVLPADEHPLINTRHISGKSGFISLYLIMINYHFWTPLYTHLRRLTRKFENLFMVPWYYFGGNFKSAVFKDTMVPCEIYTSLVILYSSWYRGNMMVPWLWWYNAYDIMVPWLYWFIESFRIWVNSVSVWKYKICLNLDAAAFYKYIFTYIS